MQNKVVSECEQQMIAKHTERFYTECRRLVENELTEGTIFIRLVAFGDSKLRILDLSRMYQLLSRIPDVFKPMLKVIEDYVVEIGLKAVESLGEQAVKVGSTQTVLYLTAPFYCRNRKSTSTHY